MDIKQLIGQRIKEIRKRKNLTQEQLAEMLDLSQNAMSYIETGENFFSADTLEKLIKALDIEPYDLFQVKHLETNAVLLNEIINLLNKNPDRIKDVYQITKALTI